MNAGLKCHAATDTPFMHAPVDRFPPELFGSYRNDADIYAVGTQETCDSEVLERLLSEQIPISQYIKVPAVPY